MEPLRGTNKATWCVKLLLTTIYVYQVDCGSFCALLRIQCYCGWYFLPSASPPPPTPTPNTHPQHPPHPPPARPSLINFIRNITAVDKNHLKNQQCQLDGIFSYKSIATTYTVCLAWLHCSTSESQWLKYFKLIFLEIQNVPLRTVFANPVTFVCRDPCLLNNNGFL